MEREHLYPTLSDEGARTISFMQEHPNAPIFRNQSGNKLTSDDIVSISKFETELNGKEIDWNEYKKPKWLHPYIENVFKDVPYYRNLGLQPKDILDLPSVSRLDFSQDIAKFVPDSLPLDRVIMFQTTGTTGNPLSIPSHPLVAAKYLPFHKKALRRYGVELHYGKGQIGVALIGYQRECFTYVSVTPTMNESGLVKINLHPNEWRHLEDRTKYLDALNAEIFTGDPLSFSELLTLPLKSKPKALLSVGMALTEGFKLQLEERFNAPVIDIYSLNEAGPVAVFDPTLNGHLLLQPNLYIELLDENDKPVATGERGEITLTGGFNFCLPLLRYRTGDYASLKYSRDGPVLTDFSGRKPVRYWTKKGEWINNIDITRALRTLPVSQFSFHQKKDGNFSLSLDSSSMHLSDKCLQALQPMLGDQKIKIQEISMGNKIQQYTSNFKEGVIN